MRTIKGNLFDLDADAIVIPVNGYVKRNGHAVMGRGVALQAVERYGAPTFREIRGEDALLEMAASGRKV